MMRCIKCLLVVLLLFGCANENNVEQSPEINDSQVTTTTPQVTTTTPITTVTTVTTQVTTTTTPVVITTTTTTTMAPQGSVLSPVTSDYVMGRIEAGDSFYAYLGTTECPHCQAYKPIVENVLATTSNVDFFYIMLDTDTGARQSELLELLQLEYIPLSIKVVDGVVVDKEVGALSAEQLKEFMN